MCAAYTGKCRGSGGYPDRPSRATALGMQERSITESFFKGRKRDAVLPLSDLPQPEDYTGLPVARFSPAASMAGAILILTVGSEPGVCASASG